MGAEVRSRHVKTELMVTDSVKRHRWMSTLLVLWSRDEMISCRCADLKPVHIHCPCNLCSGRAVLLQTLNCPMKLLLNSLSTIINLQIVSLRLPYKKYWQVGKFGVLMQNEFWHYFNLADCSLQHMKLCSFIILAAFKFGVTDPICQIAKSHRQNFSIYGMS